MLRAPLGQLFDAAKKERQLDAAKTRFIALTPHRMQLVPKKYHHDDVTHHTLVDPMVHQICVLDSAYSHEQVQNMV
jgi:hypothetical protein